MHHHRRIRVGFLHAALDRFGQLNARVGLHDQFAHQLFGFCVGPFSFVDLAYHALVVHQVVCGPVAVVEVPPGGKAIVLGHRVVDVLFPSRRLHVCRLVFEAVLGCMHANNNKTVIPVSVIERGKVLVGALAVDASIGPEIHQRDGLQAVGHLRFAGIHRLIRVKPTGEAGKLRHHATILQLIGFGSAAGIQVAASHDRRTCCCLRTSATHIIQRILNTLIIAK